MDLPQLLNLGREGNTSLGVQHPSPVAISYLTIRPLQLLFRSTVGPIFRPPFCTDETLYQWKSSFHRVFQSTTHTTFRETICLKSMRVGFRPESPCNTSNVRKFTKQHMDGWKETLCCDSF